MLTTLVLQVFGLPGTIQPMHNHLVQVIVGELVVVYNVVADCKIQVHVKGTHCEISLTIKMEDIMIITLQFLEVAIIIGAIG